MNDLQDLTQGLFGRKGLPREQITRVERDLDVVFPADFGRFLESYDAAEGYVVGGYLQIWPVMEMADLNRSAQIEDCAPGLAIVATDAGGDGYGLDRQTNAFVSIAMIGMSTMQPEPIGRTFEQLLRWIANRNPDAQPPPVGPPATHGLVIYEKHPIILGGSPTDPDNKMLIPLAKYTELVAWWNGRIRDGFVDRSKFGG